MLNSSSGGKVVLYVNDEKKEREGFERTFSAEYKVLTAADAPSALRMARSPEAHVGIVVADFRMAEPGGIELLRQIAASSPHIIRVLIAAHADGALLQAAHTGEIFRVLERPLDHGELGEALRLASDLQQLRSARLQRLQAIDEILSFLAHELNTPLAAILNFSRGMQDRLEDTSVTPAQQIELKQASMSVGDNARYCLALLSSFVETVRRAEGAHPLPAAPLAHELTLSFLDTYPLSPGQRAAIRVDLISDFSICALPDCVSLVLSSLLGNALRALASTAAPAITFTVCAGDAPCIRITDNGPGIPREVLERLLADPVTPLPGPGSTGRGLVFCKRIMQALGGSLDIHSEPGRGTAITLQFPAATSSCSDTPPGGAQATVTSFEA